MGSLTQLSNLEIVFFDIETSGFCRTDDILQISMLCEDAYFNRYAKPTKDINPRATSVHGLTNNGSDLFLRDKRVESSPLRSVLIDMLKFLRRRGDPCVLVAHNCSFDASRLLFKIKDFSLVDEFRKVIAGFTDTLSLFRERFPHRRGKDSNKLTTLAKEFLNLSPKEVHAHTHDSMHDVEMLEKLALKFFTYDDIVKSAKCYNYYV